MDIEEGLVIFIEAQVPSAGKGYPLVVPQDLSGWAYQRIPNQGQQLAHGGKTGFVRGRFQITVTGGGETPYADAKVKANAIENAMHGYKGLMGTVPVDYCNVRSIDDDWAEAQKLPVQRLDLQINYRK
jgi:hypothetical protein